MAAEEIRETKNHPYIWAHAQIYASFFLQKWKKRLIFATEINFKQ